MRKASSRILYATTLAATLAVGYVVVGYMVLLDLTYPKPPRRDQ